MTHPPAAPKARTMQPADFRAKILNGDPLRDWLSRRYGPGDNAEAVRQSAAIAEPGN